MHVELRERSFHHREGLRKQRNHWRVPSVLRITTCSRTRVWRRWVDGYPCSTSLCACPPMTKKQTRTRNEKGGFRQAGGPVNDEWRTCEKRVLAYGAECASPWCFTQLEQCRWETVLVLIIPSDLPAQDDFKVARMEGLGLVHTAQSCRCDDELWLIKSATDRSGRGSGRG